MVNEGIVANDTSTEIKSKMLRLLWKSGRTTPDDWEKQVFYEMTGHQRDDIDWSVEDNHAGYFTWLKSFDALIQELIEDGYIAIEETGQERFLVPIDNDHRPKPYHKG